MIETIDPLNFSTVRLQTYFLETKVGDATGFFCSGTVDGKPNYWLVTNWHVLTGRNSDDPAKILHRLGALPDRVKLSLVIKGDQSDYEGQPTGKVMMQEQTIQLYDGSGMASWYQHKRKNEFDVAAISVGNSLDRYHVRAINEVADCEDMAVQVGSQVFILGYPLGFSHFVNMPIWKSGSIASEPNLETPEARARVVIDATTRSGMSGGPVVLRQGTHYLSGAGAIKEKANATRWIGVYSSRPNLPASAEGADEDRRAEVGYFFKRNCVHEAITDGILGPRFGEPT